MTHKMQMTLLTKVNAPYKTYMSASVLASALSQGDFKKGQVNSFFTEVSAAEQAAFAKEYAITEKALMKTASEFSKWSGQKLAQVA